MELGAERVRTFRNRLLEAPNGQAGIAVFWGPEWEKFSYQGRVEAIAILGGLQGKS